MPVYEYVALGSTGKEVKGTINADNIRVARQKLRANGIFPTRIEEGKVSKTRSSRDVLNWFESGKLSTKSLAVTTRQLSTLVGSGIPLVESLQAVAEQTDYPVVKKTLVSVREKVEDGTALAKAMTAFPKAFPRLYVNMVASGEASGTLDSVFLNLADYLEAQLEMKRKVITALFYPCLMLFFCVGVIIVLLTYVVPSIVEIFKKQNAPLPWPTQLMIALSDGLLSYWPFILVVIILSFFGAKKYYQTPKGKSKVDHWLIRFPIIGKLYQRVYTARVSQTLSTLLASGVGLLTALDIVRNTVGNVHVVKALEEAKEGVQQGRSLAKEISKSGLFPQMLSQMIAVGEKSGRLEGMLEKAGQAYDREVNATLQGLTTLIEPMMIIGVGGIVFAIVMSVLLPMTNLMDVIQK